MYNRYIGNTGKRYIVEDDERGVAEASRRHSAPASPAAQPNPASHSASHPSARSEFSFSSLFRDAKGEGGLTSKLRSALSGILPEGMEIGDLLLIIVLLLLYLEKEDEDILIMLSALIYLGLK